MKFSLHSFCQAYNTLSLFLLEWIIKIFSDYESLRIFFPKKWDPGIQCNMHSLKLNYVFLGALLITVGTNSLCLAEVAMSILNTTRYMV